MKKYFVLALALIAFAVAPVMAEVAVSGEYDFSAAWNTGDQEYASKTNKMEFDVKAVMDDYNTFKFELEEGGLDLAEGENSILDEPLTLNYAHVITDWGKYFGTADKGFGIVSSVGLYNYGYSETVDFTGYELEYSDAAYLTKNDAMRLDFDIMGIVKPYFAMNFDTYSDNGTSWLIGSTVDYAPVFVEVYYMSDGDFTDVDGKEVLNSMFGLEAMYTGEVADGVELTAGGYFRMTKSYAEIDEDAMLDESWSKYGVAAGVSAYGATVNLGLNGFFLGSDAADVMDGSYALANLGIDATYSVLEWLELNAGMLYAMGDYATDFTEDETFLGMEFGVSVMPGKGIYRLGYISVNEDAGGNYTPLYADATPAKGGIYFLTEVNY